MKTAAVWVEYIFVLAQRWRRVKLVYNIEAVF